MKYDLRLLFSRDDESWALVAVRPGKMLDEVDDGLAADVGIRLFARCVLVRPFVTGVDESGQVALDTRREVCVINVEAAAVDFTLVANVGRLRRVNADNLLADTAGNDAGTLVEEIAGARQHFVPCDQPTNHK